MLWKLQGGGGIRPTTGWLVPGSAERPHCQAGIGEMSFLPKSAVFCGTWHVSFARSFAIDRRGSPKAGTSSRASGSVLRRAMSLFPPPVACGGQRTLRDQKILPAMCQRLCSSSAALSHGARACAQAHAPTRLKNSRRGETSFLRRCSEKRTRPLRFRALGVFPCDIIEGKKGVTL